MRISRVTKPLKILGSTVNMVSLDETCKWIFTEIESYREIEQQAEKPPMRQLLITGFHGLHQANKDAEYFSMGNECDLWVPDSIAPVVIGRMRGMNNVSRVPGIEIMTRFFEHGSKNNYSCFFYGDTENTLLKIQEKMAKNFSGIRVVGSLSPPFRELSSEEIDAHTAIINQAKPDVLWVGLGLPKQDLWIFRNKNKLNVPVAAGVGAAFGFLAGTTRRAPTYLQKLGLEWFYMLLSKPKRTGRRVLFDGSNFIVSVLKEEIQNRKKI